MFDKNEIEHIQVFKGYPGKQIEMITGVKDQLIEEINSSKKIGPVKYAKTHRIILYYLNGRSDTLLTNGTIHQFKGWYESKTNILEKYKTTNYSTP